MKVPIPYFKQHPDVQNQPPIMVDGIYSLLQIYDKLAGKDSLDYGKRVFRRVESIGLEMDEVLGAAAIANQVFEDYHAGISFERKIEEKKKPLTLETMVKNNDILKVPSFEHAVYNKMVGYAETVLNDPRHQAGISNWELFKGYVLQMLTEGGVSKKELRDNGINSRSVMRTTLNLIYNYNSSFQEEIRTGIVREVRSYIKGTTEYSSVYGSKRIR